ERKRESEGERERESEGERERERERARGGRERERKLSCWPQQTLLQSAINIQWHSIPFEEECVCVCVRQRERVCVCFGFLEVFVSRLPLISLSVCSVVCV